MDSDSRIRGKSQENNMLSKDYSFCKIIFLGTLAKTMICKLETPFTSWNDCIKFHKQYSIKQNELVGNSIIQDRLVAVNKKSAFFP